MSALLCEPAIIKHNLFSNQQSCALGVRNSGLAGSRSQLGRNLIGSIYPHNPFLRSHVFHVFFSFFFFHFFFLARTSSRCWRKCTFPRRKGNNWTERVKVTVQSKFVEQYSSSYDCLSKNSSIYLYLVHVLPLIEGRVDQCSSLIQSRE